MKDGADVSFGPFHLQSKQRLLLEGSEPVRLGSRALEILIVLLERPGELVTKRELMARVWPNLVVVEGNLTVHIAALRRALRDGRDGNRYVINIPGQGYRFVAPVTIRGDRTAADSFADFAEFGPDSATRPLPVGSSDLSNSWAVVMAVASALGLDVRPDSAFASHGAGRPQIPRTLRG